jgi:hypothetical protein
MILIFVLCFFRFSNKDVFFCSSLVPPVFLDLQFSSNVYVVDIRPPSPADATLGTGRNPSHSHSLHLPMLIAPNGSIYMKYGCNIQTTSGEATSLHNAHVEGEMPLLPTSNNF